jgi:small GTP-binding protein
MARTQRNKATEHHFGMMKARLVSAGAPPLLCCALRWGVTHRATHSCECGVRCGAVQAKLKTELMEGKSSGGGKGEGFDVVKSGDARVALIGFPSVGKSTLLSTVTKTQSEAASYEFTTLTCIPGVIDYKDSKIQLLDLPGIIEGASKGKGRGRQVIGVARTSDMIVMMLDASKGEMQKQLLTKELEAVGIRINQRPPNISIKVKKTGGVKFNSMVDLTHVTQELARDILHLYRIHNAEVLFREDATTDEMIDVLGQSTTPSLPPSAACCLLLRAAAGVDARARDRRTDGPTDGWMD